MKTQTYPIAGDTIVVHFPETNSDVGEFVDWLQTAPGVLALDTETTDLDIFKPAHRLRLVQIGDCDTAWVLDPARFRAVILAALEDKRRYFVAHNAPFDLLVLDRHLGVSVEDLGTRTFDTRIFSHLLDPRSPHEGGIGQALKPLSEVYVDPTSPDTQKSLYEVFRKEYGATKDTGWAKIDLEHPLYVLYAGLDVILASRLFAALSSFVKDAGLSQLSTFEHQVMVALCILQRRGIRVDVPYTMGLRDELRAEAEQFRDVAARYGVENVNSTKQVSAALVAMGETLTETTRAGAVKVDKGVLLPLADLDRGWARIEARAPNPLADAVLRSKRADKWATSYADAFLDLRDERDRLHPFIGALQARTARMSVARPPLQQLPSGDWKVRRALVADPGELVIACDYAQVEMRVLAALSEDKKLMDAIKSGTDLHAFTARMVYGDDFTKAHRKLMKGVGFGKVYGGGAATLSRQTGAPIAQVQNAIRAYDRVYPGIRRYSSRLQQRAEFGAKEVVTPSGRHLPLDRDRTYSATNYMVQSTARDVLAEALLDMFDAGLGDYLLLPVHDEVIAQAPAAEAADVVHEIARVMDRDFYGVPIVSDPEVYGPSWGHGYGAPT